MFVLGFFVGGDFHSRDVECPSVGGGEAVVFDGTQTHWSDDFEYGDRVSIVFSSKFETLV